MKNSIDSYRMNLNFTYVYIALFFLIYEILSSIFVYLPILYGIFFCYMFYLLNEKERNLAPFDWRWYFSLFFLFFIDTTHNFFVFSSLLAFLIFYYLCAEQIKTNLKIGKFITIIFVLCAYLIIGFLDFILSYINNEEIKTYGFESIVSIFIECFIAYVFFKDKIQ